jgi:GTPase SAR1 family protein
MSRFTEGRFSFDTRTTIGVEYGKKIMKIEEKTIQVSIWDTAG